MLAVCVMLSLSFYKTQIGCLVKDFDPGEYMDKKEAKRQGRYTQFAMAATDLALKDAKLDTEAVDKASASNVIV